MTRRAESTTQRAGLGLPPALDHPGHRRHPCGACPFRSALTTWPPDGTVLSQTHRQGALGQLGRKGRRVTKDHNQGGDTTPRQQGRRQFMFGAAAAGVGLAAGLIADANPADAANGDSLQLGLGNTATATTTLTASNGSALRGRTTANGNIGLEGNDASPNGGYAVFGSSAKGYGVYGVTGAAHGVYGTAGSGFGVFGNSDTGTAVYANSNSGTAVIGNSGTGFGLYGRSDGPDRTSLYINGNAEVSGTLSKGGGSFKIDHPLDPAHKYLYHSFVESPDMMNVYNGSVILNTEGRATVELPDWFETLNRDFRYQLTAVGAAAPDLHIAAKISNGTFSIAGGKAALEVSWQVTGVRQDAWANANRIPVEVDKPPFDQGRYLHPDLYEDGHGQPIEALTIGRGGAGSVRPSG